MPGWLMTANMPCSYALITGVAKGGRAQLLRRGGT
jgi:hypothetical protein